MTRFEATVAVAILAALGLAYSPAMAQYIEFNDGTKQVAAEVKGGKAPKGPRVVRVTPAEPGPPPEPTFTVPGGFEPTKERAKESAIRAAVDRLHEELLKQDPPIAQ